MQVASDLHLKPADLKAGFEGILDPSAAVLILAGDICELSEDYLWKPFLTKVAPSYKTVLWLCGNHEHHYMKEGHGLSITRQVLAAHRWIDEHAPNVYIIHEPIVFPLKDLDPEQWADDPRRLVIATLWTHLYSPASREISTTDFDNIPHWTPQVHNASHMYDQRFLKANVRRNDIVVTHHPPVLDQRTSAEQYRRRPHAHTLHFGSHTLAGMDVKPPLWIFGHTHHCADFEVGPVRLVSNARGHPWEDTGYRSDLVVKLP